MTKHQIEELVRKNQANFKWEDYRDLIKQGNSKSCEEYLLNLSKNDPKKFNDKAVLNIIYVIGKIGKKNSQQLLLTLARSHEDNQEVTYYIIDAAANLSWGPQLPISWRDYLLSILYKHNKNKEIVSTIAYLMSKFKKYEMDPNDLMNQKASFLEQVLKKEADD